MSTAVAVLGDSIDHDGGGWQGEPWLLLVVPSNDSAADPPAPDLIAWQLAGETLPERCAEMVDAFRETLPIACALVIPVELVVAGEAAPEARWASLIIHDDAGRASSRLRDSARPRRT